MSVPNPRLELISFLYRSLGLAKEQIADLAGVSEKSVSDWLLCKCDPYDASWEPLYRAIRAPGFEPFYLLDQSPPRALEDQGKTFRLIRPAALLYPLEWRACVWVDLERSARFFVALERDGKMCRHWIDSVPPFADLDFVEEQVGEVALDWIERFTAYAS